MALGRGEERLIMDIKIDEQEYRDLLDIMHIADVVLSGHGRGEDKRSERHRLLIQKFYGMAKAAGFGSLMGFDKDTNMLVPSPDFERNTLSHVVLSEFGEHLFWDHLINKLAQRDTSQVEGGIERVATLDEKERHRLFHAIQKRYAEEFQANDIANLRLVEPFIAGTGVPTKTSD
jgi:hypothetical protein